MLRRSSSLFAILLLIFQISTPAASGLQWNNGDFSSQFQKPEYPGLRHGVTTAPDKIIRLMLDEVQPGEVYAMVGRLSGEQPVMLDGSSHLIMNRNTYGIEGIGYATRYAYEQMSGDGLSVTYQTWADASNPNVIGEITGLGQPDRIFILSAHLDDMPQGAIAPGADDNASGAAGVLVAANVLRHFRFDCTIRFILFTGEEQGLKGSAAYVESLAGQEIEAALNLDMIGWNSPGSDATIQMEVRYQNGADLAIADAISNTIKAYSIPLSPAIYQRGAANSDQASFWYHGYPAVLAIEDFRHDFNPYYHTTGDRLEKLDITYLTNYIRAVVGMLSQNACLLSHQLAYIPQISKNSAPVR